jgi:hypothetical protein
MYLVIKEDYRRVDYSDYAYEIEMHSNDYSLAVLTLQTVSRERLMNKDNEIYTFKVVEFPSNFKFESEIDAEEDKALGLT